MHEVPGPCHVSDIPVAQLDQMLDCSGDAPAVVHGHDVFAGSARVGTHRHGWETELREQCGTPVLGTQVDEEDTVHPAVSSQSAIAVMLGAPVRDDVQHQGLPSFRQNGFHTREERRKERVRGKDLRRTGHHESHRPGPP